MGICLTEFRILVAASIKQPFCGTVATLGRQHVYLTEFDVRSVLKENGVSDGAMTFELHCNRDLAALGYVSDGSLLLALGFNKVVRIDVDNYESVDEILDLNSSVTPSHLIEAYDAIMDFGTLEHVFHIPNAMAHLSRMLRAGGRIVHMLPASNCVEHGFYSFSPTFIRDYYLENRFHIDLLYLCNLPQRFERSPWTLYEYPSDFRQSFPLGRLGPGLYALFAIVSARQVIDIGKVPQQGFYRKVWDGSSGSGADTQGERNLGNGKAERFVRFFGRTDRLENFAWKLVDVWRAIQKYARRVIEGPVPLRKIGRL